MTTLSLSLNASTEDLFFIKTKIQAFVLLNQISYTREIIQKFAFSCIREYVGGNLPVRKFAELIID